MPVWLEPAAVVVLAALMSGVIGLDRELRGKPAGLRTNMVVGTAAAAFTYLSAHAFPDAAGMADPSRVAAQIVSGIGFLGGGAIFAAGGKPHGLTTAAALWGSAAVGMCVGANRLPLAIALVVVTVGVLWPMEHAMGRLLGRASKSRELLVIVDDLDAIAAVRDAVVGAGYEPRDVDVVELGDRFRLSLTAHGQPGPLPDLLGTLAALGSVTFVSAGAVDADVG